MSQRTRKLVAILVGMLILVMDTTVGAVSNPDFESSTDGSFLESEIGYAEPSHCEIVDCIGKDRLPKHTPLDSRPPVMDYGW